MFLYSVVICYTFQVDPDAFNALVECIAEGNFDTCEQVPAGVENGFLIQPIGGIAVDMAGPARYYILFVRPRNLLSSVCPGSVECFGRFQLGYWFIK